MAKLFKGVRFDPDKLKLVMEREGLGSAQQVVNWFLDAYYWKVQLGLPVTGATQQTVSQPIVNGATKPAFSGPPPAIDQYAAYKEELERANSIPEIEGINKVLQKDPLLTPNQKKGLEVFGREVSKNLNV